jgi:N utilization substance protein A
LRSPSSPGTPSLLGAVEEISEQFQIPVEDLVRAVEDALAGVYKRTFEPEGLVIVHLDRETGTLTVRERVTRPDGGVDVRPLPAEGFLRLAAHTARQAVQRHLQELEWSRVREEMARRRGELVTGVIDRLSGGTCYVDLGTAEGVMPHEEQIPGEELVPGRPMTAVILEPRRGGTAPQVAISRASRLFVQKLLEAEVPEVASGAVEIRAIAREPGVRTKIAVASREPGIDAVGACVGPKGVRHQSLLGQLSVEHLDIVPFSEEPERYVTAALGPARVTAVEVDSDSGTAHVVVPTEQLSLAIGKDGQNARLAAKLTGWRVDIRAAPADATDATQPAAGR